MRKSCFQIGKHNLQLDTSLRKERVCHKPETIAGRLMTPILMQVKECPRGGPEPNDTCSQQGHWISARLRESQIGSKLPTLETPLSVAALPVSSAQWLYT